MSGCGGVESAPGARHHVVVVVIVLGEVLKEVICRRVGPAQMGRRGCSKRAAGRPEAAGPCGGAAGGARGDGPSASVRGCLTGEAPGGGRMGSSRERAQAGSSGDRSGGVRGACTVCAASSGGVGGGPPADSGALRNEETEGTSCRLETQTNEMTRRQGSCLSISISTQYE